MQRKESELYDKTLREGELDFCMFVVYRFEILCSLLLVCSLQCLTLLSTAKPIVPYNWSTR